MELTEELIAQASDGALTNVALPEPRLQKVSCLKAFANILKLDLSNNRLQSVKALSKCRNLKWLSLANNDLQSLDGIEALANLVVLNGSCNKLSSIREVEGLVELRALIVNDNKITILCKLQKLTVLSTLVLSKNPISNLGAALENIHSLSKLSLSNCKLQELSSIGRLAELKELRLAHNSLKCLSREIEKNSGLLTLDLGGNLLNDLADVEVVKTLPYLRNLNVQGNPLCIRTDYEQKLQAWLPTLRVLNGHSLKGSSKRKASNSDATEPLDTTKGGLHPFDKEMKAKKVREMFRTAEDEAHQTSEEIFQKTKKKYKAGKANKDQLIEPVGIHRSKTIEGKTGRKGFQKVDEEQKSGSATAVRPHEKIYADREKKEANCQTQPPPQVRNSKYREDNHVLSSDNDGSKSFLELIGQNKLDTQGLREQSSHGSQKRDAGLVSVIENRSKALKSKKSKHMSNRSSSFSVCMVDVDIGGGGQSSWN